MVFSLEPEALIVGHVQLPGVDNTDRIQVQLYRQDFAMGHERWVEAGDLRLGERRVRFSELAAGTYKLSQRNERNATLRYSIPAINFRLPTGVLSERQ